MVDTSMRNRRLCSWNQPFSTIFVMPCTGSNSNESRPLCNNGELPQCGIVLMLLNRLVGDGVPLRPAKIWLRRVSRSNFLVY